MVPGNGSSSRKGGLRHNPYTDELDAKTNLPTPCCRGTLEHVERAGHVGVDVEARLLDGGPHARARGKVHDRIEAPLAHDAFHRPRVAQVDLVQGDVIAHGGEVLVLERGRVEVVEIVEHGDGMAVGEEVFDQV